MSVGFVFDQKCISRRAALSVLTGTAAVLTQLALRSTAARAEAAAWREYRDEEMGFRVEMPGNFGFEQLKGEFTIEEPMPEPKPAFTRWIRVKTASVDGMLGVCDAYGTEFRGTPPTEYLYKWQREGRQAGGLPVSREQECMVSGLPAREFIREQVDDANSINRLVIVENRAIGVGVFGLYHIHTSPTVRRFLDSLTLLRGGR
jgi:hypothetical protein